MKILLTHNSYQQAGGEDAVVAAEAALLAERGHEVITYRRSNEELNGEGLIGQAVAGLRTTWSSRSYREIAQLLKKDKPDIAHFHNTFPLISPAVYYACEEIGVPVVQTLHNYRLLCPASTFLRDGKVCEECLRLPVAWPGIAHGCYRASRRATAAVAAMQIAHRAMRTWQTKVNVYIALSEFARGKFIEGGLPGDRIVVKPNFVAGNFKPQAAPGKYAVFVGRLSEEKGAQVLLSAWRTMQTAVPLRIIGGGPLLEKLSREIKESSLPWVELAGRITPEEVRLMMLEARFLVSPSICYENFPLAVAESFACGVPVIASRLGSMAEIVQDGVTGLHFEAGNVTDLAAKAEWAWNHSEELARMGLAARAKYEANYTSDINYERLLEIYHRAMAQRARRPTTHGTAVRENGMRGCTARIADYGSVGAAQFPVLGVRVDAVQIADVIARMEEWIAQREACQYIAVTGMHGVTEALHDATFKEILNAAGMVVPDGYPLVWLGRRKGFANLLRRVYGPELMETFCTQTERKSYRHFFYGGAPGVAEELAEKLVTRYRGITVAGTYCPPFRELTAEEDRQIVELIERARPDIVWVGMSTPKQERWMFEHRGRLNVPVLVGVGAAFDFHTGRVPQAPRWMREHGLEWLFRLAREPRRLWRRYLVYGSEFTMAICLESMRLKNFTKEPQGALQKTRRQL
jgi:exopolysaccharide biosynthesis WecB/TagA/CpsF family protein